MRDLDMDRLLLAIGELLDVSYDPGPKCFVVFLDGKRHDIQGTADLEPHPDSEGLIPLRVNWSERLSQSLLRRLQQRYPINDIVMDDAAEAFLFALNDRVAEQDPGYIVWWE